MGNALHLSQSEVVSVIFSSMEQAIEYSFDAGVEVWAMAVVCFTEFVAKSR